MSKSLLVQKLGNAIRLYRGVTTGIDKDGNKEWRLRPLPSKAEAILRLAAKLDLPPVATLKTIDSFQSFDEFRNWVKSL